eukprot:m.11381 g.11381  ORF g.11381 m.11381 type:complete len:255 (+) comp9804_c0_seq1:76-840(+)
METMPVLIECFNLRYDTDKDGEFKWAKRRKRVVEHLVQLAPDVIGMQEVLVKQRDWLKEKLPAYSCIGVGRSDGRKGGEFVPLWYNKDTVKKIESGSFWLSKTPDKAGSIGWGAKLPRVTTWAIFAKDDVEFCVVNCHLSHVSEEARNRGAQLLLTQAQSLANGRPLIVMGDMNALPSEAVYSTLSTCLTDVGADNPQPTFNRFNQGPAVKRIDYLFASSDIRHRDYRVHLPSSPELLVSDHYPISAYFDISRA